MTAEAETVHVRVWQDGVEALDRHFRAPRRGEVDLLAEAIEAGRRDPVAVGALRGRGRAGRPGRRAVVSEPEIIVVRPTRRPRRAEAAEPDRRVAGRAVAARGRADWATTGGSTPVAIYRRLAAPPLRRRGAVGRRPCLVGRRPLRAARPPALERQAVRRRPARPQRRRGRDRRRPATRACRCRSRTSTRSGRARRSAEEPARPGVPRRLADELRAAGLPRAGRLAGLRPRAARGRRGRAHPVGLPGLGGASTRPSWRWRSRPRPTSSRTSSGSRSTRRSSASRARCSWSSPAPRRPRSSPTSSGPARDPRRGPAQLARREGAVWILDEAAASRLPGR